MATRGAPTRSKKKRGVAGAVYRSYDAAHPWHIVHPYHGRDPPTDCDVPREDGHCMVDLAIAPPPNAISAH